MSSPSVSSALTPKASTSLSSSSASVSPSVSVSSVVVAGVGVGVGVGAGSGSVKQTIQVSVPKECENPSTLTVQDNNAFTHRGAVPILCVFESPCTVTSITIRNAGTAFYTILVGDSAELTLLTANFDKPNRRNEILNRLEVLLPTALQMPVPAKGVGVTQLSKPKIFRTFSPFIQQKFSGLAFMILLCEPFYDGPMEVGLGWINVMGQRVKHAKRTDTGNVTDNRNEFDTKHLNWSSSIEQKDNQQLKWTLAEETLPADQQQKRQHFAQRFYRHGNGSGQNAPQTQSGNEPSHSPRVHSTHTHLSQTIAKSPAGSLQSSAERLASPTPVVVSGSVGLTVGLVAPPKCVEHRVDCVERHFRKQVWMYVCGIQTLDPTQTPCRFTISRDEWQKKQTGQLAHDDAMEES